jgi:hypothetical protein
MAFCAESYFAGIWRQVDFAGWMWVFNAFRRLRGGEEY